MRIVDIVDPTVRVELDAKQNRGEKKSKEVIMSKEKLKTDLDYN